MSRIGKKPVAIPSGVTATISDGRVNVKGPKGELSLALVEDVSASQDDGGITITPKDSSKRSRAMWGMSRSQLDNLVVGVTQGFKRELELKGTGYRAQMQGKSLKLALGLSHDVVYEPPEGIEIKCASQTEVEISGIDKQKVGQVAAVLRSFRPPEPYKGKGIRYKDEYIFMKEGKKK